MNDNVKASYGQQVNELQKLSYDFYAGLASGKEPLTYAYSLDDKEDKGIQVEVNAVVMSPDQLRVDIDFDSDWSARWIKKTDGFYFTLTPDNKWIASTFEDR